jgi:hypothetical protein
MPGTTKISRVAFDLLLARAGLDLGEAQKAEIYAAYASLEMLCERLHAPLPLAAEPATIFTLDGHAS